MITALIKSNYFFINVKNKIIKLVYFGVLSAIQPSSALKNMKFDIKQITKSQHIVTKYKSNQKRFQPDDSGTKKLDAFDLNFLSILSF